MASEKFKLVCFKPLPGTDPVASGQFITAELPHPDVEPLDTVALVTKLKTQRGFKRTRIKDTFFSLDLSRSESAMEGHFTSHYISVGFYGNFDVLAEPLYRFMSAEGLTCYSPLDKKLVTSWPKFSEPKIDKCYSARMLKILQVKTQELRLIEPNEKVRIKLMTAFLRSAEFHERMAEELKSEKQKARTQK